jgi:hypothetical protein
VGPDCGAWGRRCIAKGCCLDGGRLGVSPMQILLYLAIQDAPISYIHHYHIYVDSAGQCFNSWVRADRWRTKEGCIHSARSSICTSVYHPPFRMAPVGSIGSYPTPPCWAAKHVNPRRRRASHHTLLLQLLVTLSHEKHNVKYSKLVVFKGSRILSGIAQHGTIPSLTQVSRSDCRPSP